MEMRIVRLAFSRAILITQQGISSSLLKEMLDLMPPDTKFVGCGSDPSLHTDYMFFSSESFAEVPQGGSIPDITVWFRTLEDGRVYAEKVDLSAASISSCRHNWKSHSGLRDSYDYCTLCNVRRSP